MYHQVTILNQHEGLLTRHCSNHQPPECNIYGHSCNSHINFEHLWNQWKKPKSATRCNNILIFNITISGGLKKSTGKQDIEPESYGSTTFSNKMLPMAVGFQAYHRVDGCTRSRRRFATRLQKTLQGNCEGWLLWLVHMGSRSNAKCRACQNHF